MTTQLASQASPLRRRDVIGIVVTALFSAAALVIVVPALRYPGHVDQITIDNPHAWEVHVAVTDDDRHSWLGIGIVERENQHTFDTVIDQGDTWIFDFAYAGEHAELRLSRRQLEQSDWQVTVPDELADRLRTANVAETPP